MIQTNIKRSVYLTESMRVCMDEEGVLSVESEEGEEEVTPEKVVELMFSRLWKLQQKITLASEVLLKNE